MRVLIVEDEQSARDFLVRLIQNFDSNIHIIGLVDSVEAAVDWFTVNQHPDFSFFDIQLADGLSFEIFDRVEVKCPVIFTTAYEEYAIRAFKVNSIDYLLKPIDPRQLAKAIEKFQKLKGESNFESQNDLSHKISKIMDLIGNKHKERFVVSVGNHLRIVNTSDITAFYSLEKSTFLVDKLGKHYAIDYSLDKLEELVSPTQFFRIDRRYLISRNYIADIVSYSSSRLKVKLLNLTDDDMLVSRKRVAQFRRWLEE